MWYAWSTLVVVTCALSADAGAAVAEAPTTTRQPPRTLDRQGAELAWRNWLQSPESGNQNAPPRRITTKSLFITPLVCPKGQRLDRNGCVQVVTVNKDEHERILLEQLNALFTSAPSGDVLYDYDDNEPGPLQLSIPIGLDPQAAPLQAQEPSGQAQELQTTYVKVDKKDEEKPDNDASIEAELEILKLSHHDSHNKTSADAADSALNNLPSPDKPKRDSPSINDTKMDITDVTADAGQKELVYGHVNVDPVVYDTVYQNPNTNDSPTTTGVADIEETAAPTTENTTSNQTIQEVNIASVINNSSVTKETKNDSIPTVVSHQALRNDDKIKLSPVNDYSDIGEAIKLISRYAEVTTDDNFAKDQKKHTDKDDSILGTRTKLQHRRKQTKNPETVHQPPLPKMAINHRIPSYTYYKYPWPNHQPATPPADYPFRHLQDYWPGRPQLGGVYNAAHENPRRHHHNYPHNYLRSHNFNPYGGYPDQYLGQNPYPQPDEYQHRVYPHHANFMRPYTNNQDLYSLLGLRHWFSSEGTSKR